MGNQEKKRERVEGDYVLWGDTVCKIEKIKKDKVAYELSNGQTVTVVGNIIIDHNILLACGFHEEEDQFVLEHNDQCCRVTLNPTGNMIYISCQNGAFKTIDSSTNINVMVLSELQYILRENWSNYELKTDVVKLNNARK